MTTVIVGLLCAVIFFVLGVILDRLTLESMLKKDGYFVLYDSTKEPGKGRYKIINIRQGQQDG
jgi:hypothetical protein